MNLSYRECAIRYVVVSVILIRQSDCLIDATAPAIACLSDRIAGLPEQDDLRARSDAEYGDDWCGGQIEASLRAVL